ncbi:MAG: dihydropteroate synthase [Desulfobacterales bacterium]|nr:MAG: dihydropteroate synthase [Desulfobacterales bacterium]UCD88598.1 MAG: dihydropteroate synthase [Desulfobacterales bacterium]
MRTYHLPCGKHTLILGEHIRIMGILNVTPDSFSDGGRFFTFDDAVAQGQKLFEDGADILDIGGESTRPFSDTVTAEEEIDRVVPVIEEIARRVSIPISIDTTKATVARRAIEAGASMVNDVSALRYDHEMADVVLEYGVPIILMHMLGSPKTMQVSPTYNDLLGEISAFLENAVEQAVKRGLLKSQIIIDPGIGFGKTVEHNLLLIKHLRKFETLDVPILIGPSRKAFIRQILKDQSVEDIKADLPVVEAGTQAAIAAAGLNGAHIIRVHDVARTRMTLKIVNAIKNV